MGDEGFGSAFGWVSIACWIIVYSPQIIENYQLKSGEGLSVLFVVIWLLGDLCNLVGAVMAGLQATVIFLAIYYSLCDMILLGQIYYYRNMHPVHLVQASSVLNVAIDEETPLLEPQAPTINGTGHLPKANKAGKRIGKYTKATLQYTLALVFVIGTGVVAWEINERRRRGELEPNLPDARRPKDVIEWRSQMIGWTSAVLYLGSRIPQILKNFKTKCEGLSLALFLFAIAGNVTYVLSICVVSMDRQHLVANASWLAGSGLTVFLDVFVLCQFFYFRAAEGAFVSAPASRTAMAGDSD